MLVERTSILSGKTTTREIPVKEEDYKKWQAGTLIQYAMPYLSADDREFIINGITPEEWKETFG